MPTPPPRKRSRTTDGSKRLETYMDRNGLRPVAVYFPVDLHRALTEVCILGETTMQALITLACNTYYGGPHDLPPLVKPTKVKLEPHKNFTWYADVDLHKRIKLLALDVEASVQQLVLSAVLGYTNKHPQVKALKIETGFPAYLRTPRN